MMELNQTHPKYDLAMEVLCTLPRDPDKAPQHDLVADFPVVLVGPRQATLAAYPSLRSVSGILKELQKRGYGVVGGNEDKHRVAFISRVGWMKAQKDGLAYWNSVNGDGHDRR